MRYYYDTMHDGNRNILLLTVGILVLVGGVVWLAENPQAQSTPDCTNCNIILISIDTFGAKHSTVYNPTLNTTPFLKKLADERGVVFEYAYAQAPWTLPSHTAMLTGLYPWDIGVWGPFDALPKAVETLSELLAENGYATAAFSTGAFVQPEWQFDQGFDEFQGELTEEYWNDLPMLLNNAQDWILSHRESKKPFFVFVRPFELHDPYGTPGNPGAVTIEDIVDANLQEGGPTEAQSKQFETAYHEEVKIADTALREFFKALDESGLSQNTIVLITSDHGEEFGEHGTAGFHSITTYTELIHVPLVVIVPGAKPQRISSSVEVRSIPASLLEIVGIIASPSIGKSLLPIINGVEHKDRLVLARATSERNQTLNIIERIYKKTLKDIGSGALVPTEAEKMYTGYEVRSALIGPWHVIQNANGSIEVYEIYTDPNEQKNLGVEAKQFSAYDRNLIQELQTLVTKRP